MSKTRRELFIAIAERIGGERGRRMRDAAIHSEFGEIMDRPMSDAEFAAQLESAERDLPRVLSTFENLGPEDPGSWGFPN